MQITSVSKFERGAFLMEKKSRFWGLIPTLAVVATAFFLLFTGFILGRAYEVNLNSELVGGVAYEANSEPVRRGIYDGIYDGIVVEKSGGYYEIQDLNSSEIYKIRHEVYNDDWSFKVGEYVRFSFVEEDECEYKYSNLMLHLSKETLVQIYGICHS